MKRETNTFKLTEEASAEAFFDGKVIKLVGEIKHTHWGKEPESVAYLRRVEFEALVAWLSFIAEGGEMKWPSLALDINLFEFTSRTHEHRTYSEVAKEILKNIAFGVDTFYERFAAKVLVNRRDGLAILPDAHNGNSFCLLRVFGVDVEAMLQRPYLDFSSNPAYQSLTEASVTLADRLSAIIGMSTAPDTGYEIGLHNGIGNLKLLENANRGTLKTVVEDLIR